MLGGKLGGVVPKSNRTSAIDMPPQTGVKYCFPSADGDLRDSLVLWSSPPMFLKRPGS